VYAVCWISGHLAEKKEYLRLFAVPRRSKFGHRCSTHVFEALRFFPWMGWGSENSVGHYLDLICAILGFSLFPAGYLVHALKMRREE